MRRVACFAAASQLRSGETASTALDELVGVVDRWLREKGSPMWAEGRTEFSLLNQHRAISIVERVVAGKDVACEVSLDEPLDERRFFTRICLGVRAGKVHLFLELRAGAEGYEVAPVAFQIYSPRVLRDLLACRDWYVGQTLVTAKPIPWFGAEGGRRFLAVVWHQDRNLPVVAISRHQGKWLTPTLGDDLARELAGLAIVADLDDPASWAITNEAGREWSCFNGAVRVYWPIRGRRQDALQHPLWTAERLLDLAESPADAGRRIRDQLRRRLHELSTYAVDEPHELVEIRSEAARTRLETLRLEAAANHDYQRLAEELSETCTRLEAALEEERSRNESLRAQNESLQQVWDYTAAEREEDIPPDPVQRMATVKEAVNRATDRLSADLIFGQDVAGSVECLAPDAGPPDKIYSYLERLAEMNQVRRDGGLGKDVMIWLRERGVTCSGESETILNSPVEMRRRTWQDGRDRRKFEHHLKPSDGTSPDRCVRIYFAYDESTKKTIVGYVGRHPGT